MSVSGEGLRDPRAAERLGLGLALLTVLWAGVLHHGLGPSFRRKSFLEPSSFLLGDVPGTLLPALAVLVLPSFALAVAVAFLSRSALTRDLAFELVLPDAAVVDVELFDAAGRRVATLAQGPFVAGRHTLNVPQSQRLASGMYFARANVRTANQSFEQVVKAIRLR